MPSILERLSSWYAQKCNGDWEHSYGVRINTLDNPGWGVKIDLVETSLLDVPFSAIEIDLDHEVHWLRCWKEGSTFHVACGPGRLEDGLEIFLLWAESHGSGAG